MRSMSSFLVLSAAAAIILAACTPPKNQVRYNSKRSGSQCAVEKDDDKAKGSSKDEGDDAWSDSYDLQGEDRS